MIEKPVEISLSLLLPEIQDAYDRCNNRMQVRLHTHKGISQTHMHLAFPQVFLYSLQSWTDFVSFCQTN
jgi:hypothetical protein